MEEKPKSKAITKGDDDVMTLIIEVLGTDHTGGFDIDSIYKINGVYHVIEFLKCDTVRPFNSHPKRYWFNKQKFLSIWDVATNLKGRLFLVNYENSREQFLLIEVLEMNDSGIKKEVITKMTFDEFKKWFRDLNNQALNS